MAEDADYPRTLSNVIELLGRKKKSAVFVNKAKEFMTAGDVAQLQALVARMSEHARHNAHEKLNHQLQRISVLKLKYGGHQHADTK